MEFLGRLNQALQKNTKAKSVKSTKSLNNFFDFGFRKNALNKAKLENDAFQPLSDVQAVGLAPSNYATNPLPVDITQTLALNYPTEFINRYVNDAVLSNAIRINPEITRILKENGLKVEYNLENVKSISNSHLIPTSKKAQTIYEKMGHSKNEENYLHLTQAALLHDIGKAFIPEYILNKKGMLTPSERKIIELHNQLSYEILKTTDLDKKVAKIAYEHHNYNGDVQPNQENQALTIADVYSALLERRPYKKPMSSLCAKAILYDMGAKKQIDLKYINFVN